MIDFIDNKFVLDDVVYAKVSQFAEALYFKYLSSTNIKPITLSYRFIANGIDYIVADFETVLHYIIFDYQTFEIKYSSDYSQVELDLINVFLSYQKLVRAKSKPIKNHLKIKDYSSLTQVEKKDKLNKIFRGDGNVGVIYIPSIAMYTSSTIYNNPVKIYNDTTKKYFKYRYVGDLLSTLLITLSIECNYKDYKIPVYSNQTRVELDSFKSLLGYIILKGSVEVINERYYLSTQQKHMLKYVLQIIINRGNENGTVLQSYNG